MQLTLEVDPLQFPDPAAIRKALDSALRIWNAYFRRRVEERFKQQGPGWPPRAAADDAVAAARESGARNIAEHRLRSKLIRELKRARGRLERGKGSLASVQRRAAVLREFDRQGAGGEIGVGTKVKQGSKEQAIAGLQGPMGASKALQKSVAGLRERRARAEIAAANQVLGRISTSIKSKQGRGQLDVFSQIDWAGVQNVGGVVGHGANLPARPFMYVTSEDAAVLAEIVTNRLAAVYGAK